VSAEQLPRGVSADSRWNDIDRNKLKNSVRKLSQCHFVHYKSQVDCPGHEPGPLCERPGPNRLSHGTALTQGRFYALTWWWRILRVNFIMNRLYFSSLHSNFDPNPRRGMGFIHFHTNSSFEQWGGGGVNALIVRTPSRRQKEGITFGAVNSALSGRDCMSAGGKRLILIKFDLMIQSLDLPRYNIATTKAGHWSRFWASSSPFLTSQPTFLKCVLIYSQLVPVLVSCFRSKTACSFAWFRRSAGEPGSSVSIVSGYGLDAGWSRFDSRQRRKYFSSILCVQTASGAHPASCPMGTGGRFPGAKRGRSVTLTTNPHPVPRSRMSRSYTSPPKRLRGV
jgi:hypothetical protein